MTHIRQEAGLSTAGLLCTSLLNFNRLFSFLHDSIDMKQDYKSDHYKCHLDQTGIMYNPVKSLNITVKVFQCFINRLMHPHSGSEYDKSHKYYPGHNRLTKTSFLIYPEIYSEIQESAYAPYRKDQIGFRR